MSKQNILVLSQVYWPDTSSVSQHLSDFAQELVKNDYSVKVLSSQKPYEDIAGSFKSKETHKGVHITRLWQTKFKKKYVIGRLLNFLSYQISLVFYTIFLNKKNISQIIVVSVPPLLPFWAVILAKLKQARSVYWVMDIQPELSIASGLLKAKTSLSKLLMFLSGFMLKHSNTLICLDDDMKAHLLTRGVQAHQIHVVPVWPVQEKIYQGDKNQNPFRKKWNLEDTFTIMYSGNFAYCHPLDTLLETALLLKEDARFRFLFVGSGVQKNKIQSYQRKSPFIKMFPFQRREDIHLSLAVADIHCVVMGDNTIGYTHPNKVYGAMLTGRPILYIGPRESFIRNHLNKIEGNICVKHTQSEQLKEQLLNLIDNSTLYQQVCKQNLVYAKQNFNKNLLLKKMNDVIKN